MIWYILILLLLVFLSWLLFVPVILYANTDRKRYILYLPAIFKASVVPHGGLFQIRGRIFFIPFKLDPFEQKSRNEKQKTRRKKFRLRRSVRLGMIKGALHAFRIRSLEADIDTDDFTLNAWLVPVFSSVNGRNIHLQVNFEGYQSLLLDLRVTLGALLWMIIKTKYKSKYNH
jgi:hypothetical protein